MATRKTTGDKRKHKEEGKTMVETYFFDIEKCKICPLKGTCYKEGVNSKSHSVCIKSNIHKNHIDY